MNARQWLEKDDPLFVPYRKAGGGGCRGHRDLRHVWRTVQDTADREGWVVFRQRCLQCASQTWGHRACPACYAPIRRDRTRKYGGYDDAYLPKHVHGRWKHAFNVCVCCGWNPVTQSTQWPTGAIWLREDCARPKGGEDRMKGKKKC